MNAAINLQAGWVGFLVGALSGAVIGLQFHKEQWLGGYGSYPRRMLRLGHIACFGMGLLNVLFAFTVIVLPLPTSWENVAATSWIVALISMPLICWVSAWQKPARRLFPIPVLATVIALGSMLTGWRFA